MVAADIIAFGTALALGLLVGLQRQAAGDPQAGIRTFPIVTLLGAMLTFASRGQSLLLPAVGLLALGALLVADIVKRRAETASGLTGEAALLTMYGVGCVLTLGHTIAGLVIAGVLTFLLEGKERIHQKVERIGADEMRAIAQLALIGLVVLPVLPNRTFGPYDVLNPFSIWLMVVLIVGLSLIGYLVSRFLGPKKSVLAGGLLGGLISSTATTVGMARQSANSPSSASAAALIILIASVVVFARVVVEVVAVAPRFAQALLAPLMAMGLWCAIVAAGGYLWLRRRLDSTERQPVPADLKGPVLFGLIYAVVLLGVAVARQHFGTAGVYTVAAISGLTDMDAITLSTAQLVEESRIPPSTGWRAVLVGAMANLIFKGLLASSLGPRSLSAILWPAFGVCLLGGVAIIALWPW